MHAIPPRQETLRCVIIAIYCYIFGQELHRIHQCIENNLLVNMACFKKKKKKKKTSLPLNERLGGVCDRVQYVPANKSLCILFLTQA